MEILDLLQIIIFTSILYSGVWALNNRNKVVFAIDLRPNLNPTPVLFYTNTFFDVRLISEPSDFTADIDMLTYANFSALTSLYEQSAVKLPNYVSNDPKIVDIFDNKIQWKQWMVKVGLGAHIPTTFDPSKDESTFQYPIVLKTNEHFGHGVYIVHNKEDLRSIATNLKAKGVAYMLEEALTAFGLSEVFVWGSAYRGRLLAERCMKATFSPEQVTAGAFRNSTVKDTDQTLKGSTTVPFVRGFTVQQVEDQYLPCGKDLVSVTSRMVLAANLTGPFCMQFKLNNQGKFKIFETNARYCGVMARNDALFLATFIPLAFAIARENPTSKINHALYHGAYRHSFRRIREHEQRVIQTGGGLLNHKFIETERFNPSLALDHISIFFSRRYARGTARIYVGMTDAALLRVVRGLPVTMNLFDVFELQTHWDLREDIDVVASVDPAVLAPLAAKSVNPSHYTAMVNSPALVRKLNDLTQWAAWMRLAGLTDYLPVQYDISTVPAAAFPVILHIQSNSSSESSAMKTITVADAAALKMTLSQLRESGSSVVTVQEALTSIDLGAMLYGSVHKGKLLAMRCVKQTATAHSSSSNRHRHHRVHSGLSLIACSTELLSVFRHFFEAASAYSGPFCAELGLNRFQRPKLSSFHAGLCEGLVRSDALFVATMVPLSVALHNSSVVQTRNPVVGEERNWLGGRAVFQEIVKAEEAVLRSGGGVSQKVIARFDPAVVLHGIEYSGVVKGLHIPSL